MTYSALIQEENARGCTLRDARETGMIRKKVYRAEATLRNLISGCTMLTPDARESVAEPSGRGIIWVYENGPNEFALGAEVVRGIHRRVPTRIVNPRSRGVLRTAEE